MKYKKKDWIVYFDKELSNDWKQYYGASLYGKIGKIIYIGSYWSYLIEFKEFIDGISGNGKGNEGHCLWFDEKEITSLDQLKLKKLIEG